MSRPQPTQRRVSRPPSEQGAQEVAVGAGLVLASRSHPGRSQPRVLGRANAGPATLIGLSVADARFHLHVLGPTGSGKSWWLANYVLGEVAAGRGVALIDPQGDLVRIVLERLPTWAAQRLVLIDPDNTHAPVAYNPLAPDLDGLAVDDQAGREMAAEWAAENVTGTIRALYAASWGARMDDLLRGACHTLARRPNSTLADIVTVLTDAGFRARVLAEHGCPPGLGTLWADFNQMSATARANLVAPLIARLRAVLTHRAARDLLTAPQSTFRLADVLDGGILLARLPKGEIGTETSRLISGLLLAGLWAATTRRSRRSPDDRPDASIVIDEAQNALTLPISVDLALAESRGYRVSWVIAHQHLAQLPEPVAEAVDANARNKIFFALTPKDARRLVRHFGPSFTEHDLTGRPAFQVSARTLHEGQPQPGYTLDTLPLRDPVAGRASWLAARAASRVGLPHNARREQTRHRNIAGTPQGARLLHPPTPAADPAAAPAAAVEPARAIEPITRLQRPQEPAHGHG